MAPWGAQAYHLLSAGFLCKAAILCPTSSSLHYQPVVQQAERAWTRNSAAWNQPSALTAGRHRRPRAGPNPGPAPWLSTRRDAHGTSFSAAAHPPPCSPLAGCRTLSNAEPELLLVQAPQCPTPRWPDAGHASPSNAEPEPLLVQAPQRPTPTIRAKARALLTRGITHTRGPGWHVWPLPHSWVRTRGGCEGLFSSSSGHAEQTAAGQTPMGWTDACASLACHVSHRPESRACWALQNPGHQPPAHTAARPLPTPWTLARCPAQALSRPWSGSLPDLCTRLTRAHTHCPLSCRHSNCPSPWSSLPRGHAQPRRAQASLAAPPDTLLHRDCVYAPM